MEIHQHWGMSWEREMDSEQEHLDLCERHIFEIFSSAMLHKDTAGWAQWTEITSRDGRLSRCVGYFCMTVPKHLWRQVEEGIIYSAHDFIGLSPCLLGWIRLGRTLCNSNMWKKRFMKKDVVHFTVCRKYRLLLWWAVPTPTIPCLLKISQPLKIVHEAEEKSFIHEPIHSKNITRVLKYILVCQSSREESGQNTSEVICRLQTTRSYVIS